MRLEIHVHLWLHQFLLGRVHLAVPLVQGYQGGHHLLLDLLDQEIHRYRLVLVYQGRLFLHNLVNLIILEGQLDQFLLKIVINSIINLIQFPIEYLASREFHLNLVVHLDQDNHDLLYCRVNQIDHQNRDLLLSQVILESQQDLEILFLLYLQMVLFN